MKTTTAKIIAITNHKGGVGKTTTAVNLSAGLNGLGKKILLIDLDPQSNATLALGVSMDKENIYGALHGKYALPIMEIRQEFDIVPSTKDLSAAETELSNKISREKILDKLLTPTIRANYDYILIDCPPGIGLLTLNALTAATGVIIPVEADVLSINGLTSITELIEMVKVDLNSELDIVGILITKYNQQTVLNRSLKDLLLEHFPDKVFKSRIRKNITLQEAIYEGKDIFTHSAKSPGATDYMALCHEVLSKI